LEVEQELLEREEREANETSTERLRRQLEEYRKVHGEDPPLVDVVEILQRGRRLTASIERKKADGVSLNVEERKFEAQREAMRLRRVEDEKILARRAMEAANG
jgi:hypothetical protein